MGENTTYINLDTRTLYINGEITTAEVSYIIFNLIHMILIQKCKEFLQILHKGIMLHSPQIERKEDSYTVEPNARCQRNFLRSLLKCMLMIIFLHHPDSPSALEEA